MVATTCAIPMSPSMSSGDMTWSVSTLQWCVLSNLQYLLWGFVRVEASIKESCARLGHYRRLCSAACWVCNGFDPESSFIVTLEPCAVEIFLWSVAVVMTNRPSAYSMLSAKSGMTSPTMASRSAATRPVMLGLVFHSTIWNAGGLVGMPPEAKLPSSHPPLTSRHRPGYHRVQSCRVLQNVCKPCSLLGRGFSEDTGCSWKELLAIREILFTREALLSEAGFEKLFRTQNWVRRSKLFCRWFCFLLGQAGCISVAAWTQLKDVEGSFLCFRRLVAWLFAAKRRRISLVQPWVIAWSVSCWCGVCGFSRRRSASIWIIVLNTLLPLVGPPCPSRLLPKFSAQKEYELSFFQSIPLLINSINLKRDGVRICLGKDVERWSIECFLTPPSFRYRVNYIG